jgi:hypothetical protein
MDFDLQPLPQSYHEGGDPTMVVQCVLCQRAGRGPWSSLAHAGWHWCTTSLSRTVFVCEPCTTTRRRRRARTTPPPSPSSVRRPVERPFSARNPALEPKEPMLVATGWAKPVLWIAVAIALVGGFIYWMSR